MRYRRFVVVGASGFVGRYVVRHLAAEGALIAAVSRTAANAGFLRPMGDVGQIALIDCDIKDRNRLAPLVAGAEAVINATGILHERGAQRFRTVHESGPAGLAALAAAAGVRRFVHVSAIGADPASPSLYGRSKAAGEAAVRHAFPGATILRPSLIFGPEDSFFNRFAAIARLSPALPLIGGGRTRFAPVFVGDVAAAVAAALDREDAVGRTYELGGPSVQTLRALFELILRETNRRRLLLPVPFALAMVPALFMELMPRPLLTRDQVRMLRRDAVPAPDMPGPAALGIEPTALELILPTYLDRFRRGGRGLGVHLL
ncbi:MAG: complex I NDUFA9 subunit family protein [Alphaproteobacteria bacterium]|nr:complex I NDUFA9 subunit family protein [Alphaproteobacteria bacterium]